MDILELVKKCKAIRKYTDKPIANKLLDKILEAGRWGPSVPSFLKIQPGIFLPVTGKNIINEISQIIMRKSRASGIGVNILLNSASRTIASAPAIIFIYNSGELRDIEKKYRAIYSNFKEIIPRAELSAISAAIQNMIIVAKSLGISSCWLDTPLFCASEINKLLGINYELTGVLTLGYAAEKGKRSPRKPIYKAIVSVVK